MSKIVSVTQLPFETSRSKKIRTSNFLITFNTNIRFTNEEAIEYAPKLYELAEALFGSDENMRNAIKFLDGKDYDAIESVKVTSKVEVGQNSLGSRLHLHVGLKIRHNSKIHIDVDRLYFDSNTFLENNDFPFPIVNIHVSAHKADVQDYIESK